MAIYTIRFTETVEYEVQVNAENPKLAEEFAINELREIGSEKMNAGMTDSSIEIWDVEETSIEDGRAVTKTHQYHPDYGFPDELRHDVLKLAEETNIKLAAAYYGVAIGSVYRWKKDLEA